MLKLSGIAVILFLTASAWADILEWRDAAGVRHYTNLRGEVPKEYLGSVHVIVDERARQSAPAGAAEEPAPAVPAPEAPSHAAEMVAQRLEESR